MRKKLLWAGAILTSTVAGLLVFHLVTAPTATEKNYRRIDKGMRLSDVKGLLGRPIRNPIAAMNFLELCSSSGTLHEDYGLEMSDEGLTWHDRGGSIFVGFGPDGVVTYKRFDPAVDESFVDMARRRLGL